MYGMLEQRQSADVQLGSLLCCRTLSEFQAAMQHLLLYCLQKTWRWKVPPKSFPFTIVNGMALEEAVPLARCWYRLPK